MDTRTIGRIIALSTAALCILLPCLYTGTWHTIGIYTHAPVLPRLLYPFFHANLLHAAINAWCLLSIVFIYNTTPQRLALAYLAAVTIPIDTIGHYIPLHTPTVGLSTIVFFLFATLSFEVAKRIYYQAWMLFYLAIGFCLPSTNAYLHLYAYSIGFIVALLNKPIQKR